MKGAEYSQRPKVSAGTIDLQQKTKRSPYHEVRMPCTPYDLVQMTFTIETTKHDRDAFRSQKLDVDRKSAISQQAYLNESQPISSYNAEIDR